MASQFDDLMKTLARQDRDLMDIQAIVVDNRKFLRQLIHMMGPRLDQDSLRAGIDSDELDFLDQEEGIWEQPVTEEPVFPDEEPRTRVPYKTNEGGEAFVDWNSLDEDMKIVIEIARTMPDPWQLYESPSGQMRIAVSGQVESAFRSRKLGNRTGK